MGLYLPTDIKTRIAEDNSGSLKVRQDLDVQYKIDSNDETGEVQAIVSVFGNVDSVDDRVKEEAFDVSLKAYADSGTVMNFVWAHKIGDPAMYVGAVREAKALRPGDPMLPEKLKSHGGLFIDAVMDDHPEDVTARKVHRLLKGRRINQFSFTYSIVKYSVVEENGTHIWELEELDVWEVGPCLKGANSETQLLAVKSVDATGEQPPRISGQDARRCRPHKGRDK